MRDVNLRVRGCDSEITEIFSLSLYRWYMKFHSSSPPCCTPALYTWGQKEMGETSVEAGNSSTSKVPTTDRRFAGMDTPFVMNCWNIETACDTHTRGQFMQQTSHEEKPRAHKQRSTDLRAGGRRLKRGHGAQPAQRDETE
jgi:hypothetical protein